MKHTMTAKRMIFISITGVLYWNLLRGLLTFFFFFCCQETW